jgi:hypothetical protein
MGHDSKMAANTERDDQVLHAKISEQAERYDDMAACMKKVTQMNTELSTEVRCGVCLCVCVCVCVYVRVCIVLTSPTIPVGARAFFSFFFLTFWSCVVFPHLLLLPSLEPGAQPALCGVQ